MQEKIRPGYKQTEAGVIPEDWEIRQLSDHFTIYAGGDVPKHSFSKIKTSAYPYPIFANALQNKGLYGYTGEKRSRADSLTVTGRGFLGHAEYRDEPFFPIVRLLVLEPCGALDAKFTTYAINERVEFAIESTGVPQLTAPQIAKYCIAAPADLDEQQLIVSALSDADARIAALEALVAKKRDLKQAAMQQLLTGKTRLPGFSGDWEVKRLGQIANISKGKQLHSTQLREGGSVPHYNGGTGPSGYTDLANTPAETVAISEGGNSCGFVHFISTPFWCGGHCYALVPIDVDNSWLYYGLKFRQAEIMGLRVGSGLPNVQKSSLANFEVRLPSDAEEQVAVAGILSEMDADLAALEAEAEKAQTIKQGMMQNLLTGKVRLV